MIAEEPLMEALKGVNTGRLRVHEAYRQIRAAETPEQASAEAVDDLRLATSALALELPASVWNDYTSRLHRVVPLWSHTQRGAAS